jgi:hypothetical protein
MSELVKVAVAPDRLHLPPGGRATAVLTIRNEGRLVDQFGVTVSGVDPSWITLQPPVLNLYPGTEGTVTIDVHLPDGLAAPAGLHRLRLDVLPRGDLANGTTAELPLEVLAIGGLEMTLTPQVATARGAARFRVRIANTGNANRVLELRVLDQEEALEVRLDAERFALAPGADEEITLTIRPKHRPLVARPRQHQFTVVALPVQEGVAAEAAETEPLASCPGLLIHRPPLAGIAAIPPKVRGALLFLGAAALGAALTIWFLFSPGTRTWPLRQEVRAALEAVDPVLPSQGSGGPSGPVAPPVIERLELRVPPNAQRGELELSWSVRDADEVKIDGRPQRATDSMRVQVEQDREFKLEASNKAGTVTKAVGVVLLRPPEIAQFNASTQQVQKGEAVTLSWEIVRAQRAGINGQAITPGRGSMEVRPEATTTYTLVAENELGRDERTLIVQVAE